MLQVFRDAGPCMVTHLTVPLVLELFVKWPLQTEKFRVCCQLPSLPALHSLGYPGSPALACL